MSDSSDIEPEDIIKEADNAFSNLIPPKSKHIYEFTYRKFMDWRTKKQSKTFSEEVFGAYFAELAKEKKPSTLWAQYSMLKTTVSIKNNVDISKYLKLRSFLKRQSDGYRPKKSKTFSKEEIAKFIIEALDHVYLFTKVVLIMGISGACRCDELYKLKLTDIETTENIIVVTLQDTKNKTTRKFVIPQEYVGLCKSYLSLRPPDLDNSRLFCNYQAGKCTRQFVGINKISAVPKTIATYLKLSNPQDYTGHAMRRTSATMLVNAGGNLTMLKRHGGWKSSAIAETYIDECLSARKDIASKLFKDKPSTSLCSSSVISDGSCQMNTNTNTSFTVEPSASSSSVIPHGSSQMNTNTSDKSVNIIGPNCTNCSIIVNVYQK